MTGLVKEEILTRAGELGLWVSGGRIRFDPVLLRRTEFLGAPDTFRYYGVNGREAELALEEGELAFTWCQVPVVCRSAPEEGIKLHLSDGSVRHIDGLSLDGETSSEIFRRTGTIRRVEVALRAGLEEVPQPTSTLRR